MSLNLKDYTDLSEIGRGGFGVVYSATRASDKTKVAIKKLAKVSPDRLRNELRALRSLQHKHIVEFYGDFLEGGELYIVMELCLHGSLRNYVRENGFLVDSAAVYVLRQLISAVKYMHLHETVHRDLSAGNVLISKIYSPEKLFVKLCDFGLATILRKGDTTCTVVGTPGYIAPQVYKQEYDRSADVFSLGGVLFTMLTAQDPPRQGHPVLKGISRAAGDLVKRMMDFDQHHRATLDEVLQSPFMRDSPMLLSRECSLDRRMSSMDRDRETRSASRSNTHIDRVRSRERPSSTRERLDSLRMAHGSEGTSREYNRPRRAASQPPRGSSTDGSYGNARNQEYRQHGSLTERGRGGSREPERARNRQTNTRETGGVPWPMNLKRLGGNRFMTQYARYICVDDESFVMESVGPHNKIAWILVANIRHGRQKVSVYRPHSPDQSLPRSMDDPLLRTASQPDEEVNSFERLQPRHRDMYMKACEGVERIKTSVAKVTYNKPPEFSQGTARLMESGDCRLSLPGRTLNRRNLDGPIFVVRRGGGPKQVLQDEVEARLFDTVFNFVFDVERTCAKNDRLPMSFSSSLNSIGSQQGNAFSNDAVSRRTGVSRHSQRSAPATLGGIRDVSVSSKRVLSDFSNKENVMTGTTGSPTFTLKKHPDGRVFIVENSDGRRLRSSTSTVPNVYVFSNPGEKDQRFQYNGDMSSVPTSARPLLRNLLAAQTS